MVLRSFKCGYGPSGTSLPRCLHRDPQPSLGVELEQPVRRDRRLDEGVVVAEGLAEARGVVPVARGPLVPDNGQDLNVRLRVDLYALL